MKKKVANLYFSLLHFPSMLNNEVGIGLGDTLYNVSSFQCQTTKACNQILGFSLNAFTTKNKNVSPVCIFQCFFSLW